MKQLSKRTQRGQGMTEYIIIVALIAIAAIAVYTAFGGVIRGQTGVMAAELAGGDPSASRTATTAAGTAATTAGAASKTLTNFENR